MYRTSKAQTALTVTLKPNLSMLINTQNTNTKRLCCRPANQNDRQLIFLSYGYNDGICVDCHEEYAKLGGV